jgi:hypothetical protein
MMQKSGLTSHLQEPCKRLFFRQFCKSISLLWWKIILCSLFSLHNLVSFLRKNIWGSWNWLFSCLLYPLAQTRLHFFSSSHRVSNHHLLCNQPILVYLEPILSLHTLTMKTEAACSSKIMGHHNPEGHSLNNHCWGRFKTDNKTFVAVNLQNSILKFKL